MRVYWGTELHTAIDGMTATHASVRHLTSRVEGLEHKIFMDNIFSSPRPFDDLDRRKINSCVQCSPTQKTRPVTLGYKTTKLKRGDIMVKIRGGSTALVWKDR